MTNMTWKTLLIFLHRGSEEMDGFIVDVISPVIEKLLAEGAITSWFFLRYWDGGPHIRLRVQGATDGTFATLKTAMEEATNSLPKLISEPQLVPDGFYRAFAAIPAETWSRDGEVRVAQYRPEVERYGGSAALAAAETLFHQSTLLATAILSATRGRNDQRVVIAGDLITLCAASLGWADGYFARLCRRYYYSWDYSNEVNPVGREELRQKAERMWNSSSAAWASRYEQISARVLSSPMNDLYGAWQDAFSSYVLLLRGLEESGELIGRTDWIVWSQFHMLHNRMGLNVAAECLLVWHLSLGAISREIDSGRSQRDFAYLEGSKYRLTGGDVASSTQMIQTELLVRVHPPGVELEPVRSLGTSLSEALRARQSRRGRYGRVLDAQTLSTLLGTALGAHSPGRRVYPSPGGLFSVDTYVQARNVNGIQGGVYLFDPDQHMLRVTPSRIEDSTLVDASPYLSFKGEKPGSVDVNSVSVLLYLAIRLDRLIPKYGKRALRLALTEAGGMLQNIALCAESLALQSVQISGFIDDVFNAALHLDGIDQFITGIVPLGGSELETKETSGAVSRSSISRTLDIYNKDTRAEEG